MLYPGVLPLISMFDAFFKNGSNSRKKLKLFYIAFFAYASHYHYFPEVFALLILIYTAVSSSGNFSPNGFSLSSLACRSSASRTRSRRTLRVYLVARMVTRVLVCSRSVSIGSTSVADIIPLRFHFKRSFQIYWDICCACEGPALSHRCLKFLHSFRVVFCGVFYGNIWQSRSFPFVSIACSIPPRSSN